MLRILADAGALILRPPFAPPAAEAGAPRFRCSGSTMLGSVTTDSMILNNALLTDAAEPN